MHIFLFLPQPGVSFVLLSFQNKTTAIKSQPQCPFGCKRTWMGDKSYLQFVNLEEAAYEESFEAVWNSSSQIISEEHSRWKENKRLARRNACFKAFPEPRTTRIKSKIEASRDRILLIEVHLQPQMPGIVLQLWNQTRSEKLYLFQASFCIWSHMESCSRCNSTCLTSQTCLQPT